MPKNVLITGASSGLGAGMAREFAKRGHALALCARRTDRLEQLRAEIVAARPGATVLVRALDVTQHDQVFEVFRAFEREMGRLDRIVVNAGIGKGASLGTGHFHANRKTAETNFVAALAQCEAAMEIFRRQRAGHLVTIASVSAVRGMPRALTTYAATKAALASLSEGIRADVLGTGIKVSTIFPGFIRTEMNERLANTPFIVDAGTGCRALVRAIERERPRAFVPWWPWAPLSRLMRWLPLSVVSRMA